MIRKAIQDICENDIVAREILTSDFQVILGEGTVLKREYIKRLEELGITEVFIKEPQAEENEMVILKDDIKKAVRETVKGVLERHTYRKNQELKQLSEMADNIITTILEEDHVVEKIFDIKERSSDIYEHSIQVCATAILTALKLGVEITVIQEIGVGCLLHDIGLRYMTTEYNNQDISTLNSRELVEYKKHPAYGYSSLMEEKWISALSKNIILYHHERMDGEGFPLRTKKIPFECQIVNVCDLFDEMICGIACQRVKVYEAIEYLKNFEGLVFDSKIVNAFLSFTAVYPAGTKVITNEGELAVVVSQNRYFQNRPVLQILADKDGNEVTDKVIKDLLKINNIFIEKTVD